MATRAHLVLRRARRRTRAVMAGDSRSGRERPVPVGS